MPRFLHTADWQIGRQYGSFAPEDAVPLAEARFTVVERIALLASQRQVDAVLVAGDVFDAQTVSDRTVRRLFNAMQGFAGPWVLIPGNHDAALSESVWTRARRLGCVAPPLQVIEQAGVCLLPAIGLAILAAPLTQRHTYADLTEAFDALETPPGLLRIGLAHGSVQGLLAEGIDAMNPIAPDRARRARLDYLALGDWHGCKQVDVRTWYSGTPEPDRFKDNDPGGVLEVEIDAPGAMPQVTHHAVGQYRWQLWDQPLQLASDIDLLAERLASVDAADVLQLTLRGALSLASHQRLHALLGQTQGRARCLVVDETGLALAPTDDDIASLQADGYLGEVLAALRSGEAGDDAALAHEALAILTGLLAVRQTDAAAAGAA